MSYDEWAATALDHGWWDFVYCNFIEQCALKGVTVDPKSIEFDGSGSATFSGGIDVSQFMESRKLDERFLPLYLAICEQGTYAAVRTSHRDNARVDYNSEAYESSPQGIFSGLDQDAWEVLITEQEEEANLEDAMQEWINDLCSDLARDLEREAEWLTSRESYEEWCISMGEECDA